MGFRKILITVICVLLSPVFLVGCKDTLSQEDKELIISNQVDCMAKLEDEMSQIWNSYADSNELMSFYGYLDVNSNTYMAAQEMKEVIAVYEEKIMAESNKVDKDKVDDAEFLEYLNNVNEYIFAINNYAQSMEDGNLDRFTQAKEDVERLSNDIIRKIEVSKLEKKRNEIVKKLEKATADEEQKALWKELQNVIEKLAKR